MLPNHIKVSQTTVGGEISWNTLKLVTGRLMLILIKADSTDTTFHFSITDAQNNVIFETDTKATGTLRRYVNIPINEINTLKIFNASANEAFTGKLTSLEVGS